jgi:hypothetical protein
MACLMMREITAGDAPKESPQEHKPLIPRAIGNDNQNNIQGAEAQPSSGAKCNSPQSSG